MCVIAPLGAFFLLLMSMWLNAIKWWKNLFRKDSIRFILRGEKQNYVTYSFFYLVFYQEPYFIDINGNSEIGVHLIIEISHLSNLFKWTAVANWNYLVFFPRNAYCVTKFPPNLSTMGPIKGAPEISPIEKVMQILPGTWNACWTNIDQYGLIHMNRF